MWDASQFYNLGPDYQSDLLQTTQGGSTNSTYRDK